MRLVLSCHTSHDITCGCDYAYVDLTPELAILLLARMEWVRKIKRGDDDALKISFWSRHAVYFSSWGDQTGDFSPTVHESEALEDQIRAANDGWMEVPESFQEIEEGFQARTEIAMVTVYDDCVVFECVPKHTTIDIATESISEELLRSVAGKA